MISLQINGEDVEVDVDPSTPLLWVLRDNLNMTGTKYGCGISQCGACTVLMNGQATKSCSTSVSQAAKFNIVTIEGLSIDSDHPVQKAWIEEDVPQCGYCQSGQILSAVALLNDTANPTDEEINQAMTNICRCGTYKRIRKAIHRVAQERGAD
ncbi:MAG: (2Fe-2S)-binding protein [Gammaproteobacteria bacterium]|nr:(2Fe-2S)-binding protein [Gammaproteobacteria bacterium]|tara:strand:- start:983 stop:1441 length:459 start_codon:yes stop_codon:yes gene_type:complete